MTHAWVDFACTGRIIWNKKFYNNDMSLNWQCHCRWPQPPGQQPGPLETRDIWWSPVSEAWHWAKDGDEPGLCRQGQLLARNHGRETSAMRNQQSIQAINNQFIRIFSTIQSVMIRIWSTLKLCLTIVQHIVPTFKLSHVSLKRLVVKIFISTKGNIGGAGRTQGKKLVLLTSPRTSPSPKPRP